jgi:arabinoxylan arabinofuranohydrolase
MINKTVKKATAIAIITIIAMVPFGIMAQNPIIQTYFTADPAPMVHNGTVYLYTSHDEDSTEKNFFTMRDWRCYSSTDMVNWTDHGAIASLKNFSWFDKTNGAWAPQCIERNGKFYLYVPIHGEGIAVLVADSPTGPFSDPIGKRLIDSDHIWQDIDPTILIDDTKQAYLYWGNPSLWYVKLNEDMISYDHSIGLNGIVSVEMTTEAFGTKEGRDGKSHTTYTEGPWIYKRNNLYYMIYAAAGIPEYIAYSTAPSAEGPWTYRGFIMERAPHLAFTNHSGIIDFKGNTYLFYHDQDLSRGEGFKRSVSLEQFEFNADGLIPLIKPTKEGVTKSISFLNPYTRVQAETIAWSEGLKTASDSNTGVYVTKINNGDNLKVRSVDFGKGAKSFEASLASNSLGGSIEIRIDSVEGALLGIYEVKNTGGWQNWAVQSVKIKEVKGVHDVYFVFKGGESDLFNFDWWMFK